MAFRDTWHRALVYFGLAEDHDEYLEEVPAASSAPPGAEPEAEAEERYRERPNVRRLSGRRRRDEIDDISGTYGCTSWCRSRSTTLSRWPTASRT
jgi:cell division inhibitor SepF